MSTISSMSPSKESKKNLKYHVLIAKITKNHHIYPWHILKCIDGKNDQKSLHSQADLEFQNYVDNEFDVSIEEIEPKINTSYISFEEQKQILKRSITKYKPVSLKKAVVNE